MKTKHSQSAFTLLELLTVIAIIGVVVAITVPNIGKFKPSVMAAATRQLLDDVSRARQLAISQRTTVYMVFVPSQFWAQPAYGTLAGTNQQIAGKLLDKQMHAYTFVTLRSLGDQPGASKARYLAPWRTLPEGVFIAQTKFMPGLPINSIPAVTNRLGRVLPFLSFNISTNLPFPTAESSRGWGLPYIAFNYMGQLVNDQGQLMGYDEAIPLVAGSISFARDPDTKQALAAAPTLSERPAGNATNAFNVVNIDFLTGRARLERLEVK